MVKGMPISEEQVNLWDKILKSKPNHPLINDDKDRLIQYIRFINEDLQREEKGADFGVAIFIADDLQGASAGVNVFHDVNRVSAECNNRMFAHLIHLKQFHGLEFIDSSVASNPVPTLVEMAEDIMSKFDGSQYSESRFFVEIGIKGVEYIAANILD